MEKDIVYHALKDAMEEDCCPICRLTDESLHSTMRSILYESMTDMDIRTAIMKERGFCHHHSQVFLEEGDSLAHALVYSDALRGALQDVVNDEYAPYETQRDCYFCNHARESEEIYTRVFYEAYHEEEFVEQYKKSGLLCMHHLHGVRQHTLKHKEPDEFFVSIAQPTVDKYQVMIKELDEIQRKNDYRYTGETWTDGERTAWKRAVSVVNDRVGLPRNPKPPVKKGLFGRKKK